MSMRTSSESGPALKSPQTIEATPCHFVDERAELPNLGLAARARGQRVVEHRDEELDEPTRAVDGGEQRAPGVVVPVVPWQGSNLVAGDRPAGHDADAGGPAIHVPVAPEQG